MPVNGLRYHCEIYGTLGVWLYVPGTPVSQCRRRYLFKADACEWSLPIYRFVRGTGGGDHGAA